MRIKIYLCLCSLIVFLGCSLSDNQEIKYRGYYIKGNIAIKGSDTLLQGPIEYFDSLHNLIAVINFKDNLKNGKETDYYPGSNKIKKQESEYYYGNENGLTYNYDTNGKIVSKISYFQGILAGPQFFYSSDSVYRYKFVNLENYPLYEWDNDKGSATSYLLNYITYNIFEGEKKKIYLLLYLINPPHKNLVYKIYEKNYSKNDSSLLYALNPGEDFFKALSLDVPKENCKYLIKIESYDQNGKSINKNILNDSASQLTLPNEGTTAQVIRK